MKKAIEFNVRNLKVFWNYEIIVKQAHNTIHCLSSHLKGYQNEFWELIMNFDAFNISLIPRLKNAATDFLAIYVARLVPANNKCSIELIFRPYVLDNVTNLRVFDDDQEILEFLTNDETFKDSVIDEEEHQSQSSKWELHTQRGKNIGRHV